MMNMEGRHVVAIAAAVLVVGVLAAVAYAQPSAPAWFNWQAGAGGMMGTGTAWQRGPLYGGGMMGAGWQGMRQGCASMMAGIGYGNWTSQANSVAISGYAFHPMMLVVQKGTTVTWTNYDPVAHSVESGTHDNPTGLFESSLLNQGQSFSYTFNEAGTFVYHCDPHPYMTGVVIVQG